MMKRNQKKRSQRMKIHSRLYKMRKVRTFSWKTTADITNSVKVLCPLHNFQMLKMCNNSLEWAFSPTCSRSSTYRMTKMKTERKIGKSKSSNKRKRRKLRLTQSRKFWSDRASCERSMGFWHRDIVRKGSSRWTTLLRDASFRLIRTCWRIRIGSGL